MTEYEEKAKKYFSGYYLDRFYERSGMALEEGIEFADKQAYE